MLQRFWTLCEQQLGVSDETIKTDANKELLLHSKYAIMTAAANLVAAEAVLKFLLAPYIISHYAMHGGSLAEVVKDLVIAIRKKEGDVSDIFLVAMKQRYMKAIDDPNDKTLSAKRLKECEELSACLFGLFVRATAHNKYKSVILKIVQGGNRYVFKIPPLHLLFVRCSVQHFTS